MATMIICDVCSSQENVSRLSINLACSQGFPKGMPYKFDKDLCEAHFAPVLASLMKALEITPQ